MTAFTIAAAQYPIDQLADWASYAAKLERWIAAAADRGARLAVFPEYGAMELAALDPATSGDLSQSLAFVASLIERVDELHAQLARGYDMHILAATCPCRLADGRYVNRARLFATGGKVGVQDKLIMTRFEREQWRVASGDTLRLFDTDLGRIGVLICYDAEFPLLARALSEAGMDLLLVPSCTDSLQGYWRVRIGAQARAMESQCHVVQAPTVGAADWSPAVDVNRGAAGIYGPPDGAFADDGVIAMGEIDVPQWLFAEINLSDATRLRTQGAVFNRGHWAEQPGSQAAPRVETVTLR